MRPSDAESAEAREKSNVDTSRALLEAMIADPAGTQADWGQAIGKSKGRVNGQLNALKKLKFVEERLGKWRVMPKGKEALK